MNTQSTMKKSRMSRLLKGFLGLFLFVLSLVIVLPIGAFLFFNPSDYKTQVSEFITEKSGLPLEIKGDIKMRYFPWLGIYVENVRLAQEPKFGKGDFISIDALEFKIPVSELFKRQLIVETLSIKGVNIALVKTKDGATNWDYFSKQMKQKSSSSSSSSVQEDQSKAHSIENPSKGGKKISFALNHFEVQDAQLSLNDQEKQETITLSKLQFSGEANLPKGIPVQGKFDLKQINSNTNSTLIEGHSDFTGTMNVNKNLLANLDSTIALTFPENPNPWRKANIELNINIDAANIISLKNIRLHIGDLDMQGTCTIPLTNAPITFNLKMNQLNIDQLMQKSTSNELKKSSTSSTSTVVASTQKPLSSNKDSVNKSRAINGEILIDRMIAKNLTLDKIKAQVKIDNSLVKIEPLTASLYQGTILVNISKDIQNTSVPTTLQGTLSNVQLQPLLTDLNQEHRLTGNADIDFNLSQANQLTGVAKVKIKNGTLRGIDVRYYLSVAQSLFNKEKNALADNKTTSFGDLSATLNIHDDMIDNNDLSIQSSDFKASGEGSVYLVSKTIEYKMQAWRQYRDNKEHPHDFPLAIRIKGSFDHPKIEPDLDIYLKKGMEQEVKKELNKQIEKNIGKILGGKSEKSPQEGQNDDQSADKSVQDQLQEKIEKKIDKGLKKLFKKKKEE